MLARSLDARHLALVPQVRGERRKVCFRRGLHREGFCKRDHPRHHLCLSSRREPLPENRLAVLYHLFSITPLCILFLAFSVSFDENCVRDLAQGKEYAMNQPPSQRETGVHTNDRLEPKLPPAEVPPENNAAACCSPTEQVSCCEPAAKATCCGPSSSSGCSCR